MAYSNKYSKNKGSSVSQESPKEREDKVFARFADMLIEKLENAKKTQWKQPWFAAGSLSWPKSLYGKDYHGTNAMALLLYCENQGYKTPVFATHEHIYSLNYQEDKDGNRTNAVDKDGNKRAFVHVLKGETSFPVILSQMSAVHKETKERIKWSEYVTLTPKEQQDYNVYHKRRIYNVFNVDQTNIKDARPELYEKLMKDNIPQPLEIDPSKEFQFAPLDTMIEKQLWICPIKVEALTAGQSPHYALKANEVVLAQKSQYVQGGHPESWVNDAFHEMIHSTGAEGCLDRFKPNRDRDSYAREELVAEVGAALSCHRYGIPKTIKEDTIPYVQGWLSQLHEKPEFIRTVLRDVKMATSVLDSKIEEVRRQYLGEKADDRLDIREDDTSTIAYEENGDMVLDSDEVLGADKKQGEGENKGQEQGEAEEHKRGGMHR